MANTGLVYGSATSITLSLAPAGVGLATGFARESTAINNTTALPNGSFLEVFVYLSIKLAAGTPSQGGEILVYGAASIDGVNFTDNATGTDAAITLRSPTNLVLLQPTSAILTPTAGALTYKAIVGPIAPAWGGIMPPFWSIILVNNTGLALDVTEANHTKQFVGVYGSII